MFEIAKLELRKNRLLFIGMAGTIIASLPFSAVVSLLAGHPPMLGVDPMLYFWSFFGLPLLACMFGASAGAANAADPVESAENGLPVSAERRAFAAIAGACFQVLALAVLCAALAFLVSSQWRQSLLLPAAGWSYSGGGPIVRPLFLLGLACLPLYTASSYAFAAWIGNGILGGFLGMASVGVLSVSLAGGAALQLIYGYRAPFGAKTAGVLLLGGLSLLWGIRELARWMGRRENRRLAWAGFIAAALLTGTIGSLGAFSSTWSRVGRSVAFAGEGWHSFGWIPRYAEIPSRAARERVLGGALVSTYEGGLQFIKPDGGRKTLAPGTGFSLMAAVSKGAVGGFRDVCVDDAGSLWLVRMFPGTEGKGHRFELWSGTVDAGLNFHTPLHNTWPAGITRRGTQLGFLSWGSKHRLWAALPAKGEKLRWEEIDGSEMEFMARGWLEQGSGGRIAKDRRSFSAVSADGTKMTWSLPGQALPYGYVEGIVPAVRAGLENFYLLPVRGEKGSVGIVRLNADGSMERIYDEAPENWEHLQPTPRGGLWLTANGKLYAMTPEGKFLPPTPLNGLYAAHPRETEARGYFTQPYHVLRVEEGKAFFLVGDGTFAAVEIGSGRILLDIVLPASAMLKANREVAFSAVSDGFFLHTGLRLHFVDWNGKIRDLGRA